MEGYYPFVLPKLPYPYHALEPFIDSETVRIHHDRHFRTYVDNLNLFLLNNPQYQKYSLEQLLRNASRFPAPAQRQIINNGGGVYNHDMYFNGMTSSNNCRFPENSVLKQAIISEFGSIESWQEQMKAAALSQFGSGYAWLVLAPNNRLKIVTTANQDTVLPMNLCPILLIDVWEHAYYLKYKNMRSDYIDNWFRIINWEQAEENYKKCRRAK